MRSAGRGALAQRRADIGGLAIVDIGGQHGGEAPKSCSVYWSRPRQAQPGRLAPRLAGRIQVAAHRREGWAASTVSRASR
jgi:hypothetical protein